MTITDRRGVTVSATDPPTASDPNPGLAIKTACRVATTGVNINLQTFGLGVIDGVQLVAGDRVLVKDNTDQTTNGIYAASTGVWTRTTDAGGNSDFANGCIVLVNFGSLNAGQEFRCTTTDPIVIGSSLITFGSVVFNTATANGITMIRQPPNWVVYGSGGNIIPTPSTTTQGLQEAINAALTPLGTVGYDLFVRGGDEATGGARGINVTSTVYFPPTQGKRVEFDSVSIIGLSALGSSPAMQFDAQESTYWVLEGGQTGYQGTGTPVVFKPTNGTPLDGIVAVVDSYFKFNCTAPVAFDFSSPGCGGVTTSWFDFGEFNHANAKNAVPNSATFFVPSVAAGQNFGPNIFWTQHLHETPAGNTSWKIGNGAPAVGQTFGRSKYFLTISGATTANGIDTYESGSFYLATIEGMSSGVPIQTRAGATNNVFIIPYNVAPASNVEGATGNILIGGGVLSVGTIAPISGATFQVRTAADHNLWIGGPNGLTDGITLNSTTDNNGTQKSLEIRASAIGLNQGPVSTNNTLSVGTTSPISGASFQVRTAADHNLWVGGPNGLADGITLNSTTDNNGTQKSLEIRASAIGLNQGPVTTNNSFAATLGISSGANGSTTGTLTMVGGTSGQILLQPATGTLVSSFTINLPAANGTVALTSGANVASVSNSDGSLTISPTTGAVVASLNVAHSNTWSVAQTFGAAITYGGVTLSNSVTGTGSMVLSASPTFTGTVSGAAASWSGNDSAAAFIPTGTTVVSLGMYTPAGNTIGFSANSALQHEVTGPASAVNYIVTAGAITGQAPYMQASGSDTNISILVASKGNAFIQFAGYNSASSGIVRFTPFSSSGASNGINVNAAGSGSSPTINGVDLGTGDTDIGIEIQTGGSTGTGGFVRVSERFASAGAEQIPFSVWNGGTTTNTAVSIAFQPNTGGAGGYLAKISAIRTNAVTAADTDLVFYTFHNSTIEAGRFTSAKNLQLQNPLGAAYGGTGVANSNTLTISGSNNGTIAFGTASATITFQGTDTYVGRATTDTLTNKTLSTATLSGTITNPDSSTFTSSGLANVAALSVGTSSLPSAGQIYTNSSAFLIRTKTSYTNGAGTGSGVTFTNAPGSSGSTGNPTKWIPVDDNGTTRYLPAF